METKKNSTFPDQKDAVEGFDYLNHDYLTRKNDERRDDEDNETKKNNAALWLLIVSGIVIVFIILFFIVVVFSLNQVKPPVPLPINTNASIANYDEASYLMNQLGFYKLHSNLFTQQPPVVNLYILNTNQSFSYSLVNSVFTVVNRQLDNPDIVIYTNFASFKKLVYSNDPEKIIGTMIEDQSIIVRSYSSKYNLLMKGYYPLNFLFR